MPAGQPCHSRGREPPVPPLLCQGCQNGTAGRSGPWTSPRAAREGGISRGPGFPSPGQQDIQVSVPSGEESSRWVGSWSSLRPGKATGIAPTTPRHAGGEARPWLPVFAEPVRALTKRVRPECCSWLILGGLLSNSATGTGTPWVSPAPEEGCSPPRSRRRAAPRSHLEVPG